MNIFVNLPINDLQRTKGFFSSLGFTFNPQFSDEKALCMVMDKNIFAMLLQREYFQTFTPKEVVDARQSSEVLLAISMESRQQVDETVKKAVAAGGSTYNQPKDHGFMYQHGFQDPDGHIWEVFWMDPSVVQA